MSLIFQEEVNESAFVKTDQVLFDQHIKKGKLAVEIFEYSHNDISDV